MAMKLMDIEQHLSGPDRQAALERYDETLRGLGQRLVQALQQGVPPEEYATLSALNEATTLSRKLLRLTVQEADAPSEPSFQPHRSGMDFHP
ncbi:MAG: hypothetical protein ACI4RT_07075 [Candidatus Spyradenecus sp.]